MELNFPKSFVAGTVAKAAEVMENFNAIKSLLEFVTAVEVDVGFATMTYGGGIEASQQITLANLTDVAEYAAVMPEDAGYVGGVAVFTSTTFLAKVQKRDGSSPGPGTVVPFRYIAIRKI